MKVSSVFRVTGDICFYFAVLFAFSELTPWRLPMGLFAAACLLLGLAIVRCRNAALRTLLALLPGAFLLLGPLEPLLLFPAAAWLYYVLVMARGNYAMPLEEYRKIFTVQLAFCLIFLAANIANATIYRNQFISPDSLVYAFLFLLLGVAAMRRMQMGAEMSLKWQLRNALSVVGFPILAVGLSMALFLILRYSQQALAFILAPLGRLIIWLLHKLFPDGHSPIEHMSIADAVMQNHEPKSVEIDLMGQAAEHTAANSEGFSPLLIERAAGIGAWVLLGLLLLLVLFLIVNRSRKTAPLSEDELDYEETEAAPSGKRRRKKGVPLIGNARQLRRIYKTYLEYRSARGLAVTPADTSAEILARDRQARDGEDAARLRELYIAARYGDPSAVTRAQVLEAQGCLERIVEP